MTQSTQLAVNGTLMRGLVLNDNLLDAGARFIKDDKTAPCYRLSGLPEMMSTRSGEYGL